MTALAPRRIIWLFSLFSLLIRCQTFCDKFTNRVAFASAEARRRSSIALAITTNPPQNRLGPYLLGDNAVEADCMRSWYHFWLTDDQFSAQWYDWLFDPSVRTNRTATTGSLTTSVREVRVLQKHGITSTRCDGIPRVSWTRTEWVQKVETVTEPAETHLPYPSCSVPDSYCRQLLDRWNTYGQEYYKSLASTSGSLYDAKDIDFFGCEPPITTCSAPPGCTIKAAQLALVYPSVSILASDLCARDWHGLYTTQERVALLQKGQRVTSALTLHFNAIDWTITGPFTLDMASTYIAYVGARAYNSCGNIGSSGDGLIPVPASQLRTKAARLPDWNVSGEQMALQFAQGNTSYLRQQMLRAASERLSSHGSDTIFTTSWAPLDITDLTGDIPAAKYYEQFLVNYAMGNDACRERNCSIIEDDGYRYILSLPDGFRSIDPAWRDCETLIGVWDPPLVFSLDDDAPLDLPAVPTGHVGAQTTALGPGNARPTAAPGSSPALIPIETGVPRIATPPNDPSASSPVRPQPAPQQNPGRPGTEGSGQARGNPDVQAEATWVSQLQALQNGNPEALNKVTAAALHGQPNLLVFGDHTLSLDGPTTTIDGVPVALRTEGLVLGTRTVGVVVADGPASVTPWRPAKTLLAGAPSLGGSQGAVQSYDIATSPDASAVANGNSGSSTRTTTSSPSFSAGSVRSTTSKKAGALRQYRLFWWR